MAFAKNNTEKTMRFFDGKRTRNVTWKTACEFAMNHVKTGISDIFFRALDESNAEKIVEIAQAVFFLEDRKGHNFVPADRERGLLLFAKWRLDIYEQKWTIREVAEFLAGGKKVLTPPDGFSALRRKCRDLNFPLAESRKGKKK